MILNHVADCLATSLLIKEVSDMILFTKPVILIDVLRGVSQDTQFKYDVNTEIRPYICLTLSSSSLFIIFVR
jgi:hypothetical protein